MPASGYPWVDTDDIKNWDMQWEPGQEHPDDNNLVAGKEEGVWINLKETK